MARDRGVEAGALYRKVGHGQPVWQVDSLIRHATLPHVKLTRVDAPTTQMTIAVATLTDPRFFERVSAER
jgi:hypothetical protein